VVDGYVVVDRDVGDVYCHVKVCEILYVGEWFRRAR
jgi:hypothetical protein